MDIQDPLRIRLMSHLQMFIAGRSSQAPPVSATPPAANHYQTALLKTIFLNFISNYNQCEQRLYLEIEEAEENVGYYFFLFLDALLICCRWHFDDAISEWTYYFQEAVG